MRIDSGNITVPGRQHLHPRQFISIATMVISSIIGVPAFAGTDVIDGDTIRVNGDRIRLRSEAGPIDAPELRSAKCPLELFRAEAARDRLQALLKDREPEIQRTGTDKYGRPVVIARVDGKDVGAILVREGHAKPWPKLKRSDRPEWCK